MSSLLKKLIKKKDGGDEAQKSSSRAGPGGMQTMSAELQLKYAKGVQYNMKVIIKGDRNVGKTTLFLRLQGQKFREEYLPTDEIQVANIQWNYKATDDVVKVEVWDVVDKARRKSGGDGLKLSHNGEEEDATPKLDAEFVDVYQGTHAVIMMFDMTKLWTWQYIEREIYNIPASIPVVILANHRDMGQHRTVDMDTLRYFITSLDRGEGAAEVRFTESSLLNGFGLKYLHTFFNVPFLKLQRDTLLGQLEANSRETDAISEELNLLTEGGDYDKVVEAGRQRMKDKTSPRSAASKQNNPKSSATSNPMFSNSNNAPLPVIPHTSGSDVKASPSVDDFQPELSSDALDFFGMDEKKSSSQRKLAVNNQTTDNTDDEDMGGANPMVAAYQDDLDSSDEDQSPIVTIKKPDTEVTAKVSAPKLASADVVLSSDEEEEIKSIKSDTESDDSDDGHNTIEKLQEQFASSTLASEKSQDSSKRQSSIESDNAVSKRAPEPDVNSEDSDEEQQAPVILTYDEDLSDDDNLTKQAPASRSQLSSRAAVTGLSSKDVTLTDSEDDKPHVIGTEDLTDSDTHEQEAPPVQLPDIATSHQSKPTSEKTKKKKKTKSKEKTGAGDDEDVKPKKKTKKSKKSSDEPTKEKKKKSKSAKPAVDPLEAFLEDEGGAPSADYECL